MTRTSDEHRGLEDLIRDHESQISVLSAGQKKIDQDLGELRGDVGRVFNRIEDYQQDTRDAMARLTQRNPMVYVAFASLMATMIAGFGSMTYFTIRTQIDPVARRIEDSESRESRFHDRYMELFESQIRAEERIRFLRGDFQANNHDANLHNRRPEGG